MFVYSFYLTRLCKLLGPGGDKRPFSLENFLGTGKDGLRWARGTSSDHSTACLLQLFSREQYSADRKCAGNHCFLLFLKTDISSTLRHTSVYALVCLLPGRNIYRGLYRLRSPGFNRSVFTKEIKKNGDGAKHSFRITKSSAGRH